MNCFPDGTGYVEDGREIFDDVESDEEEITGKAKKRRSEASEAKSKKKLRDVNKPVEGTGAIRKMFGKVQGKDKSQVKLDEDNILADILGEIGPESQPAASSANKSTSAGPSASSQTRKTLNAKTEMAIVKEYMQNFNKSVQKKTEAKPQAVNDDVSTFLARLASSKLFNDIFFPRNCSTESCSKRRR